MAVSIAGLALGVLLLIAGLVLLSRQGELEAEQESSETGSGLARRVRREFSLYAERSTAEMLDMLRAGNIKEALPWLLLTLSSFVLFFFLPAFIGHLAGWGEILPWLVGAAALAYALFLARPRSRP
ncbi:MAG: hypothetical protein RMM31_10820 [Anaerolineae bacterium]|nr:hypothetical protein [Anaerolineae bacterium]